MEKEFVDQWKSTFAEVDNEYKSETSQLSNELWAESRGLSPRTMCLGTDVLSNKYWVFSSRKTKTRGFGGWVIVQTPNEKVSPTGEPISVDDTPSAASTIDVENEDPYSNLNSWYYVDRAEEIRQLARWAMYLAIEAAEQKKREKKPTPKGSPNKLGQTFAVEIPSPKVKERLAKGRKKTQFTGLEETRLLSEELNQAADWIEER